MRKLSQFAFALCWALPALAAEVEHEGGSSPGLFSGNIGNAIWTLVIFVLLLWVLGKYAWGPILSGLQSREDYIRDSLEQARQQREAAEQRLADYEAKLAAARAETEELLAEARRDAEALRLREEERAKAEADKLLERARREIAIAQETAVKDLYAHATELSTQVASNILEREINPQDHERLIADSISAIGRIEEN
ncbi:MAG: F0F1 ATP synthase subunit B [Acidobacteriota bacterium]|nr:F0F1 ATP synthase subunit B [Acidobacteriota bacterium]